MVPGRASSTVLESAAASTFTDVSASTYSSHITEVSSGAWPIVVTATSMVTETSLSTQASTTETSSSSSQTWSNGSTDSPAAAESSSPFSSSSPSSTPVALQDDQFHINETLHRIVYSTSTLDRKYFGIDWNTNGSYNPNILPHPTLQDQYVLVAQLQQNRDAWMGGSYAMHCTASFVNEVLTCNEPPQPLPIDWTLDTSCPADPNPGPQDPKIFHGPNSAFALYGSHSGFNCHGMWIQDLQHLIPEFNVSSHVDSFPSTTNIQRPAPYRDIEKNYFLFWDHENNTYVHHDISPERVYTSLSPNGAVGPNLALVTTGLDTPCLDTYMPKLNMRNETEPGDISYETIHQATNSLSITLCNRADPSCQPSSANTFIMSIFNHKTFYSQHAEYFPYILLFQQTPPFAAHAISTKSIWVNGRSRLTNQTPSPYYRMPDDVLPDHSELFFIVSMAWKSRDQSYHGYMDDELMIGFGIEDFLSAGIDVLAGDLLQDLGYCENVESRPQTLFEREGGG